MAKWRDDIVLRGDLRGAFGCDECIIPLERAKEVVQACLRLKLVEKKTCSRATRQRSLRPAKVEEKVQTKAHGTSQAEQQAQEWDVLNQKEWEDMENLIAEDPIIVGEKRRDVASTSDGRSFLTSTTINRKTASLHKVDASEGEQSERKRGTSGWTKLKSRPDDVVKRVIPE